MLQYFLSVHHQSCIIAFLFQIKATGLTIRTCRGPGASVKDARSRQRICHCPIRRLFRLYESWSFALVFKPLQFKPSIEFKQFMCKKTQKISIQCSRRLLQCTQRTASLHWTLNRGHDKQLHVLCSVYSEDIAASRATARAPNWVSFNMD